MKDEKQKIIEALAILHAKQRKWQKMVENESFDYEKANSLALQQLQSIYIKLTKEDKKKLKALTSL